MSRRSSALAVLAIALVLAACSSSNSSPPAQTYAVYQFTCCTATDIEQTWHPGSTAQLHWTVTLTGQASSSKPNPITLTTEIAGAYPDVATLKKLGPAARTVAAAPITTDNRTSTPPISVFALPADLPVGLYNLTFKVDFGGGNSMSASSIVQIGP